ncbi:hypothetical protein [Streptococcus suis]|uniref:hypothetical protein n=1 Tax=Streptococcus suis TaxID=1307 RepID=UPI00147853F4
MTETIFDAIASVSVFVLPMLVAGILEQKKTEKIRRKSEQTLLREMEEEYRFQWGVAYANECMKQRALNSERQQVDKEWDRYARMVG